MKNKTSEEKLIIIARVRNKAATIFIGGQPGVGKSTISKAAMDDFDNQAVMVDLDALRKYYPNYERLQKNNDRLVAARTHKDASAWADELFHAAIKKGCNIVVDSAMDNADNIAKQCQQARDADYRTEARIIAVNTLTSRLDICKRYEEQKQARNYGRWPGSDIHDRAYAGLPLTIEKLEREKLVDRISIYNRAGEKLYENQLINGEWKKSPEGRDKLEAERNRQWTIKEHYIFQKEMANVIKMMKQRHASDDEFKTLETIRKDYEEQSAQAKDYIYFVIIEGRHRPGSGIRLPAFTHFEQASELSDKIGQGDIYRIPASQATLVNNRSEVIFDHLAEKITPSREQDLPTDTPHLEDDRDLDQDLELE